jgi:NAD-dependent deacetylase
MVFMPDDLERMEQVVEILRGCGSILFITGAGISADSGLPTYRGIGGLYNSRDTEEGISIEDALSGVMLRTRPEIAWKYIYHIEESCRGARFNRGHAVIAEMERHFPRVWVLTQNIDGFHRDAGSQNVIDIHGDVHRLLCTRCDYTRTVGNYAGIEIPPRCPACHAIVRPKVVLFGEMLPQEKCDILRTELEKGFDIVFSVGTTSVFPYIAQPVYQAKRMGKPTVEINPGRTEVTHLMDYRFNAGAAATLDALWTRFSQK